MTFFFGNLFTGIAFAVLTPMILLRTQNNSVTLGLVMTAGAIGGVAGGLLLSAWGGFKRRVHGLILGWVGSCFFFALLGFGTWIPFWIAVNLLSSLFGPLINTSNQSIWQAKVAPDVQGRVFSARTIIAWITFPISPIIGGTLADYVLEPALRDTGFTALVPPGPGAGIALLIILCNVAAIAFALGAYFVPAIRHAEDILPDHDQSPAT
jgi:MFS family permease